MEDANDIIVMLQNLAPLDNFYEITFLRHPSNDTYVLHITIFKTTNVIPSTSGLYYVRINASNNPINTPEKRRRLDIDKGIIQFENEIVSETIMEDAVDSHILDFFCKSVVPDIDKIIWLKKQRLCYENKLTVSGTILFTDEPQIYLAKHSAIKVYRYKTTGNPDRDTLDVDPITVEGCAYYQIYKAVKKVKEIIETIRKLGKSFENIEYPEETIHEIVTNAVLHRDYSIPTDIQIRIFDNRVEVESPGKLPGYVTIKNILETQSARNPKLVRLINKFPNPPNKDVGEGLNTAFEAMNKLRLKPPIIKESDNSVLVVIRHEKLASPEEIVMEYLINHDSIRNSIGRQLTGIKSENSMKTVFYKLRDQGYIYLERGVNIWKRTVKEYISSSELF